MTLFITVNPENDYFWKNHPTYEKARRNEDTGLDIPMQKSEIVPTGAKSHKINLKFKGEQNKGYMLVPRSSISKTNVRLANSIVFSLLISIKLVLLSMITKSLPRPSIL